MLAGIIPIGPDRQYILFYQAFYIWWAFSIMKTKKVVTGLIGNRIIHLVSVLCFFLFDYHVTSDNRAEVVKEQTCPHFHFNVLAFLGMEIDCTNGMF